MRKTVTVLFCDVTGSTAMGERLDPESTRRVMARYFDAMREAIERHEGTVEKFIGDAVMAVFGIPVVHEDDALRAVRAAADMREALGRLNDELQRDWGVRIESRIGVNTGEVVTGEGDSIATGDAVNVGARLEQGAAPGETLLGESTHRLVRDSVEAEPVEPLIAKGKSQPLRAFRLVALVEGAEFISRHLDSLLVGRENELAQLQRAYDHAVSERVAYQFTLLGTAGIGKSRLVRELHHRVDAELLSGRCLPYGEGITYWPLLEIESMSAEIDFEANRDEIALQTRRILERKAREQPLLVVFDDLQWAEPTFLDLIDHVTDLARDAPMLLVCVARAELLDQRPGWGGGKLNATTMLIEALSDDEAAQLVENLLLARMDSSVKERIASAAEGNPLYVEEMLAMVGENGSGDIPVPPTIQALLAARLDRLTPDERTTVECAAVQGQEFRHDALVELVPDSLAGRLGEIHQSLVRKDLVRPTSEGSFRFKHLLLREAAYEALPKEQRAELHERFAEWVATDSPELQEIIGYHLEQTHRYRAELGPVDDHTQRVARRASTILAAAGRRAADRGDVHATVNLLERAVALLPEADPGAVALYPDLAAAIYESGDLERPAQLYRAAAEQGDPSTARRARLRLVWLDLSGGASMAEGVELVGAIVAEAERSGDEVTVAEALWRLGVLQMWIGDSRTGETFVRKALDHSLTLDAVQPTAQAAHWMALLLLWGSTPVEEALEECRRLSEATGLDQTSRTELQIVEGALVALAGDLELGRKLAGAGRQALLELGQRVQYAGIVQPLAIVELLYGNASEAENMLRESRDLLTAAGERGYLSTISGMLALTLAKQERYDEAKPLAEEARRLGAEDDVITQIYWRVSEAHVSASKGDQAEAARLAAEVIELAIDYDSFDGPLAIVEVAAYLEPKATRAALERALERATAKGSVVMQAEARRKLAALP